MKHISILLSLLLATTTAVGQATPSGYPLPKPIPASGTTPASGFLKPGAPIAQTSYDDDYAAAYANISNGGLHSVGTLLEMTNTPTATRIEGMLVYVAATSNYFRLAPDLVNWIALPGMTNSNFSGSGITGTTNLYTHDGTLAGNRTVTGNGKTLTMTGLLSLSMAATNTFALGGKDVYLSTGNYSSNLLSSAEQNVLSIDPTTGRVDFEPVRNGRTIATATLLATVDVSKYTNITTLGRAVVGDGGGGKYWYVAGAPTAHVNDATVWRGIGSAGNWYYDLAQTRNGLNVLLFNGVRNSGGTLTCDAGLRDAMAFCKNPTYGTFAVQTNLTGGVYGTNQYAKLAMLFPAGVYTISSITNSGVSMFGAMPGAHEAGSYVTNGVVIFQQPVTATAPMIVADHYGFTISGITFKGAREQQTGLQLITSWSSRTNFVYVGSAPTTYGYDAYASFYDALNQNFLGTAPIQSISGSNAVIYPGEDLYSSDTTLPSNNSMYVRFAPTVTIDGYTDAAPAMAGSVAIMVYSTTAQGFNSMVIKDCFIENFHTGIVIGQSSVTSIRDSMITQYGFAGIASLFSTVGLTDVFIDKVWLQGYYAGNTAYADPNSSYTNTYFRNGRFGVWNANGNVLIGSLVIDGSHTGVTVSKGNFSADSIVSDVMYREGIKFRRNPGLTARPEAAYVGSLTVGVPYTSGTAYLKATLPTDAAALRINSDFRVHVGSIQVPIRESNNQKLPYVYRTTDGMLNIGSVAPAINITSVRNTSDAIVAMAGGATNAVGAGFGLYKDPAYAPYDNLSFAINGNRAATWFGYGVNNQLVMGDPSVSGQFHTGGLLDYRSSTLVAGATSLYGAERAINTAKFFVIQTPVYNQAGMDQLVELIHYDSGAVSSQTRVAFGYPNDADFYQAPSKYTFYVSPYGTKIPQAASVVIGVHTNAALEIDANRHIYVPNGKLLVRNNNQSGDFTGSLEAAPVATSAALEVRSSTHGLLLPRMSKTQRDAISSPVDGLVVYQTNGTAGPRFYVDGAWYRATLTADP